MNNMVVDPGSFRDPKGRVFLTGDKIYRITSAAGKAEFEFVQSTGLLDQLVANGHIVTSAIVSNIDFADNAQFDGITIEHEKIPYISYPYEWSFSFLKVAALLHLDVHLQALDVGVTLSDASAYNVQFRGPNPVFIDILSFRKLQKGEAWEGHRQFCEQFLNPLLLRAKLDLTPNAWYRGTQEGITTPDLNRLLPWYKKTSWNMLTQVVAQSALQNASLNTAADAAKKIEYPLSAYISMLSRLRNWIATLVPANAKKTEWQDYSTNHSYHDDEKSAKARFIADFAKVVKPEILWDIGCNTGDYTKTALENGAGYSVGFDFDQGALDAAYARARNEKLAFQPLFLDGANPSPSQGWNESERRSMSQRRNADAVIALAFIHHLVIGRNIPLGDAVRWLVGMAPQGVIEFVPKNDPMVLRLLALRQDIFTDYSEETFLKFLSQYADIVKSETVTEAGRSLHWFKRK
ncbi:MAG: class I SAM-dependent methyltransferase [Sneathiella sp.]|nr:class I SAM-dependent methyltransferase [Sneathiella sp.]